MKILYAKLLTLLVVFGHYSNTSVLQVCSHCYKCTRDKYQGLVATHTSPASHCEPPPKKRKSSRAASVPEEVGELHQEEDGKTGPADVECPLCHRKVSHRYIHTSRNEKHFLPPKSI